MAVPANFTKLPNGIEVEGWKVTVDKGAILSEAQSQDYMDRLDMHILPEMVFGMNKVVFEHEKARLTLTAFDALRSCVGPEAVERASKVHVAAAEFWKEREHARPDVKVMEQNFDWTYTSLYQGTVEKGDVENAPDGAAIDFDKLRARDPILFYDECVFFEDELGDNGIAHCSAKVRVMPKLFLCLLRFWLRVDGVILRVHDTRIYHEYGSPYVIRQYQQREDTIADLEARHPELGVSRMADPAEAAQAMTLTLETTDVIRLNK